jgi:hypothetical protein
METVTIEVPVSELARALGKRGSQKTTKAERVEWGRKGGLRTKARRQREEAESKA